MSTIPTSPDGAPEPVEYTPESLAAKVDELNPTIDHVLASIGAAGDRQLKSRARVLAAHAIRTFDPSQGAQLHTWVSRQLMPLRRMKRKSDSAAHVPEGIQLDAMTLMRAEQDFLDKHEREPDLIELSDHSKLPVKRIKAIRETFRPVPSEAAFTSETQDLGLPGTPNGSYSDEALDYIYRDADYIDRKILEMKTGYGGAEMLTPAVVAQRLGLTPTQLSRRSAKLALQIQEIEEALRTV